MKNANKGLNKGAPGARLQRMLNQFAVLAGDDLQRMPSTPGHSVHALRTRMKKIRSVLRLVHGQVAEAAEDAISWTARDIKDAFDTMRNNEVMERLAHKWAKNEAVLISKKRAVVTIPKDVRLKLRKLQRFIAALPLNGLRWKDVFREYEQTYRSARRWMRRAGSGDADDLHHWRRRVKDLYYQSLALHHLGGSHRRIRQSRQLGSRLGKSNDLELMRRYFGATLSENAIRRVQRAQAALQKKIYVIGPKLFRHDPDDVRRSLQRRCPKRA
ncbi:MAG: CHAD domain-containing protein [Verrucomicrobiaceae bacterium]